MNEFLEYIPRKKNSYQVPTASLTKHGLLRFDVKAIRDYGLVPGVELVVSYSKTKNLLKLEKVVDDSERSIKIKSLRNKDRNSHNYINVPGVFEQFNIKKINQNQLKLTRDERSNLFYIHGIETVGNSDILKST